MKFAILAAGEGQRLKEGGINTPKPLLPLAGETLLTRLIRIFHENKATQICVVVNAQQKSTIAQLQDFAIRHPDYNVSWIAASTPSSMHSLAALHELLGDTAFCLTTVDTIFDEKDFAAYILAARNFLDNGGGALMGVTTFVDDESPLYVATSPQLDVTGFHDTLPTSLALPYSTSPTDTSIYISGGIYCFSQKTWATLHACLSAGQSRMRNFQRALLTDQLQVKAHVFVQPIVDIDHPKDLTQAENFVKARKNT